MVALDVVLTNRGLADQTLEALTLQHGRGVVLVKLVRGGEELPFGPNTVVNRGDLFRLAGAQPDVERVGKVLGYIVGDSVMVKRYRILCALVFLVALAPAWALQLENKSVRESTITARIEQIGAGSRMLTLKTPEGVLHTVYVSPDIDGFSRLNRGDTVVVRYLESVIVRVNPAAKPKPVEDTTAAAREAAGATDREILQQLTTTVTIEEVNERDRLVVYRTHDNMKAVRAVEDSRLLDGLKRGDRVEVTLTRARAISVEPVRR